MARLEEQTADLLCNTFSNHKTAAVILCAGNSSRMNGINKQLEPVNGVPVLAWTLMAYQSCPLIKEIVVVTRIGDFDAVKEIQKTYSITKMTKIAAGGSTRQESARIGFEQLDSSVKYVAIADGARCLTTSENITKVCLSAYRHEAASAGHLVSDSVKRCNAIGAISETVDRTNLWAVQTPQVFHTTLYAAALVKAENDSFTGTDDNALVEHLGYKIFLEECGRENLKITTEDDLPLVSAVLSYREVMKS